MQLRIYSPIFIETDLYLGSAIHNQNCFHMILHGVSEEV